MQILSLILSIIAVVGLYPRTGYVVETDRKTDLIVIEDASGNLWELNEPVEDWCIGDGVSMIMWDNGTPEIYDDAIVATSYSGFCR